MSQGRPGAKGDRGDPGSDLRWQVLVAFLLLALFCILTAFWQNRQTSGLKRAQRAAYANCVAVDAGHLQFNKVLDQLARNAANSKGITADQKAEALKTYASIHLPILECGGLAP